MPIISFSKPFFHFALIPCSFNALCGFDHVLATIICIFLTFDHPPLFKPVELCEKAKSKRSLFMWITSKHLKRHCNFCVVFCAHVSQFVCSKKCNHTGWLAKYVVLAEVAKYQRTACVYCVRFLSIQRISLSVGLHLSKLFMYQTYVYS